MVPRSIKVAITRTPLNEYSIFYTVEHEFYTTRLDLLSDNDRVIYRMLGDQLGYDDHRYWDLKHEQAIIRNIALEPIDDNFFRCYSPPLFDIERWFISHPDLMLSSLNAVARYCYTRRYKIPIHSLSLYFRLWARGFIDMKFAAVEFEVH